jgi:hypothetical protein
MLRTADRRTASHTEHDPRIERALRTWLLWGTVAVLLLPAARGHTAWLGWMPLWLVAMPASAWWALHRFALPHWPAAAAVREGQRRRRRGGPQARRRDRTATFARRLRAA